MPRSTKICIGVIILLLISNVLVSLHSYGHKIEIDRVEGFQNKFPLLEPALPLYDKKDLIVNIQELRNYLIALPDQNSDWADMSIYFEVLNTGASVSVNNDTKIWPASLAKLPVGMIAVKKVEKGEWDLQSTKFTLVKEDADPHTPNVNAMIGQSFTLQTLLEKMLLESDNTAYHMLVRELSEDELVSIANAVGLNQLFTVDQKFSAKDYTRLLRCLYDATYLDEEHSQYLLDLLNKSDFKNFLRAGIPESVPVSHKWGISDIQDVYADSGIVYANNRPYIISIMIQGKTKDQLADQAKAEQLIKDIGQHTYDFMSKQ